MKVAMMGFKGAQGKTTLAANLLAPRMNDAPILSVETLNEGADSMGLDVEKHAGDRFRNLYKRLALLDDAIIDVGASNVQAFMEGMAGIEDSHAEVDIYLVPVTPGQAEQKETVNFIETLKQFGVAPDKIKVIFNRVESAVEDEFPIVLAYARKTKACEANPDAAVFETELFDLMAQQKVSMRDALADTQDYKALAKAEANGDKKLLNRYTDMLVITKMAKAVNRNLDTVYHALFG